MRLPPFRGSDVMPETKLELFQDEILRHPLKLCEFYPSQVPHLAVAKEFLVGLADNDDAALVGNKVFAQPTASTAEQPIAATLPQCSTPSQSSGAAARLKSANSPTASGLKKARHGAKEIYPFF